MRVFFYLYLSNIKNKQLKKLKGHADVYQLLVSDSPRHRCRQ